MGNGEKLEEYEILHDAKTAWKNLRAIADNGPSFCSLPERAPIWYAAQVFIMGKEHDNRPSRLMFERVVEITRDITLRDGGHAPTLIVEGSLRSVTGQLDALPNTPEEKIQLFGDIGFQLGQEGTLGGLEQVFFICEGWMSMAQGNNPPLLRPSKDPNRKEVLFVTHLSLVDNHRQAKEFEMVRNAQGKLVVLRDLLSSVPTQEFDSPFLDAFVAGFREGARGRLN